MNTILMGIDPGMGKSPPGALAVRYPSNIVSSTLLKARFIVEKLDVSSVDSLREQLEGFAPTADFNVHVMLELVGEGNIFLPPDQQRATTSMKSQVRLARHSGHIEGILTSLKIPFEHVRPRKWMDQIVPDRQKGNKPEQKNLRKTQIQTYGQQRFPDIKKIHKYAGDAVAILAYLMDQKGVV